MRQDLSTLTRGLLPALLAAALTSGCANLAADVVTELVKHDLKAIDQQVGVIEGDLALFKKCLTERGGSCTGSTATPLLHTTNHNSSTPVTPTNPGSSTTVQSSLSNLPPNNPAQIAHDLLSHPVTQQATAFHDHVRGLDVSDTSGVSVQRGQGDHGGPQSTVTMDMKVHHVQHFHDRLLASIRTGAWAALHKHCQSMLASHQGAPDYKALESTCRHTAFVRAYMEAYLRKGEFLEVKVDLSGVVAKIQDAGNKVQNTIGQIESAISQLGTDVGQAKHDTASQLATLGTTINTDVTNLVTALQDAEKDGPSLVEEGIQDVLSGLAHQVQSAADSLLSHAQHESTAEIHVEAELLSSLIGQLATEVGQLDTEVGQLDTDLVNRINTDVGKANSKLSNIFKVSSVGFVSRDGDFQARLPTIEATIDPSASRLITFTDQDETASGTAVTSSNASDPRLQLTGHSSLSHLGVATDTSGVGTGAGIGAELVRVFLEAVFDASEGLPAIAPVNQGPQPSGLNVGQGFDLPPFTTTLGHVSAADLADMQHINDRVATSTKVLVARLVSGIGPFSLNNPSLEALITEVITTSVRKAMEKVTWCWYSCDLDAAIKNLETDVEKTAKDMEAAIKAKIDAEEKKIEDKLKDAESKLQAAIKADDQKAREKIEAEMRKLRSKLEAHGERLQHAEQKAEAHAEHVSLRLKLSS